jgi:hypothetical protein
VNCYETKQYKKGIKNAETILKKYPNHGETLAMKGMYVIYVYIYVRVFMCICRYIYMYI